jgi:hypothetical protein
MIKNIVSAVAVVAAMVGIVGVVQTASAGATQLPNDEEQKVTICHRHNSVTNPYNKESVSKNAVDGEGKNDHTHHTGPVATSEAVAQALKDSKTKWGDIIPPFDDFAGYNWTTEGQAIYNNDCNYVETPKTPDTSFSWKCVEATTSFVATFKNSGDADSAVSVNDQNVTVGPEETKDVTVVTGNTPIQIKVTVDGEVVFDRAVACFQGQGTTGGTVTTQGQGAVSLPNTAGDSTGLMAIVASIVSALGVVGSLALRMRAASSL